MSNESTPASFIETEETNMRKRDKKNCKQTKIRLGKLQKATTEAGFEPAHPKVLDSENRVNSSLTL